MIEERIVILETNVDDVKGEILGNLIEKLIEDGALDVQIIPAIGKKCRPSYVIKVLTKPEDKKRLARKIMQETGTLGVRVIETYRYVLKRDIVTREVEVEGKKFEIRIKVAEIDEEKKMVKPEFEDLVKISKILNKPVRDVEKEVLKKIDL